MIPLRFKIQSILRIVLICSISSALTNIPELPKALIPQDLNWCWMASVLNCLYRVVPFRKTLSDVAQNHQKSGVHDSLDIYLNNLFTGMSYGDQDSVNTNMYAFYNRFISLGKHEFKHDFKHGETDDLSSFYETLSRVIFLNSEHLSPTVYTQLLSNQKKPETRQISPVLYTQHSPNPTNAKSTYYPKPFFQILKSPPRLAPICALVVGVGNGLNYFTNDFSLPDFFTKTDQFGEKKYELVACAYGGGGHANAYIVKFNKWYGVDTLSKKLAPTEQTIQSITTQGLKDYSLRLWFYEQIEPEWNVPSPLQQKLTDLSKSLQTLKNKLALLKTRLKELKKNLMSHHKG